MCKRLLNLPSYLEMLQRSEPMYSLSSMLKNLMVSTNMLQASSISLVLWRKKCNR